MRAAVVTPAAALEILEASLWYERQRRGLGSEFLLAFDGALAGILRLPEGHEVVARRTRRALLRRFPYTVLYVIEEEQILIMAVFHGRRDPRRWADRVRERASRSLEASGASVASS